MRDSQTRTPVKNTSHQYENAIFLNADSIVKIELAASGAEEVASIITLATGERLEVAGTPEDLVTHERYFYPKPKEGELI